VTKESVSGFSRSEKFRRVEFSLFQYILPKADYIRVGAKCITERSDTLLQRRKGQKLKLTSFIEKIINFFIVPHATSHGTTNNIKCIYKITINILFESVK
jgi:hypothetical protein